MCEYFLIILHLSLLIDCSCARVLQIINVLFILTVPILVAVAVVVITMHYGTSQSA
jgi:hypothetical protein